LDADFPENEGIVPAETAIATFTTSCYLPDYSCYLPDLIFRLIFFSRSACAHHALRAILYDKFTGRPIPVHGGSAAQGRKHNTLREK
jgi:hypothetical protein